MGGKHPLLLYSQLPLPHNQVIKALEARVTASDSRYKSALLESAPRRLGRYLELLRHIRSLPQDNLNVRERVGSPTRPLVDEERSKD